MDPKIGSLLLTASFGELVEKNTDATLFAEKKKICSLIWGLFMLGGEACKHTFLDLPPCNIIGIYNAW